MAGYEGDDSEGSRAEGAFDRLDIWLGVEYACACVPVRMSMLLHMCVFKLSRMCVLCV